MRIALLAALLVVAAPAAAQPADDTVAPVLGTQTVDDHGEQYAIDFLVSSDVPWLRVRDGSDEAVVPVHDPALLLAFLAAPRLKGLWQPILDWAGDGLAHAAERHVAATRAAYELGLDTQPRSGAQSSTRPKTRTLMQYADALRDTGKTEAALALLREARGDTPGKGWGATEWTMLNLRIASYIAVTDKAAAIRELERGEAQMRGQSDALNFMVNRAALLAETGRFAEALATIDSARAGFDALQDGAVGAGDEKFPGSERQFDWVRACALKGLGKRAESAAVIRRVRAAPEPTDAQFLPSPNLQISLRAALCMRDHEALVADFVQLADRVVPPLALQPALADPDPAVQAVLTAARRDPRVVAATKGRIRVLPVALTPALNRWRKLPAPTGN